MKKLISSLFAAACASTFAVEFTDVLVRQQWPWSTDVLVEYKVSGLGEQAVDIRVSAYDGDTLLALPADAVGGEHFGVTGDGVHRLTIDPVKVFGNDRFAVSQFKVALEASASAENINEVIYKVYDLQTGTCQDVKRSDFYNNKMGAYETDFAKVGAAFGDTVSAWGTSESDLIIWTGVTNDIAYKTTKLVMRKIPAKDKVWTMGDSAAIRKAAQVEIPGGFETNHLVKITYNYWMGVFELTRKQTDVLGGTHGTTLSVENPDVYPDTKYFYGSIGSGGECMMTLVRRLRERTGVAGFDMPSEAEWEFACRAGTSTCLPSGKNATSSWWSNCDGNLNRLAWMSGNSNGTLHPVGQKAPNAFGLYDVLGNAMEGTRDTRGSNSDAYYASFGADWTPETVVEDPPSPTGGYNLLKGGGYDSYGAYVRSGDRTFSLQNWTTAASSHGLRVYMKE